MRLYRSKGYIWTGTEADAKAANDGQKGWEKVEVPTDKPNLIAWLNEHAPGVPPVLTIPPIEITPEIEDALERASTEVWQITALPEPEPELPSKFPLMKRDPKVEHPVLQNIYDRLRVEDVIDACDDRGLDDLQAALDHRRQALARKAMLEREETIAKFSRPDAPPARARVRTRVPVQPVATEDSAA